MGGGWRLITIKTLNMEIWEPSEFVNTSKCWEDGVSGEGMETPCLPIPHTWPREPLPFGCSWVNSFIITGSSEYITCILLRVIFGRTDTKTIMFISGCCSFYEFFHFSYLSLNFSILNIYYICNFRQYGHLFTHCVVYIMCKQIIKSRFLICQWNLIILCLDCVAIIASFTL